MPWALFETGLAESLKRPMLHSRSEDKEGWYATGQAARSVAFNDSQLARTLFLLPPLVFPCSFRVRIVLCRTFLIFLVIVLRCLEWDGETERESEREIPHCNVYVLKHVQ